MLNLKTCLTWWTLKLYHKLKKCTQTTLKVSKLNKTKQNRCTSRESTPCRSSLLKFNNPSQTKLTWNQLNLKMTSMTPRSCQLSNQWCRLSNLRDKIPLLPWWEVAVVCQIWTTLLSNNKCKAWWVTLKWWKWPSRWWEVWAAAWALLEVLLELQGVLTLWSKCKHSWRTPQLEVLSITLKCLRTCLTWWVEMQLWSLN